MVYLVFNDFESIDGHKNEHLWRIDGALIEIREKSTTHSLRSLSRQPWKRGSLKLSTTLSYVWYYLHLCKHAKHDNSSGKT